MIKEIIEGTYEMLPTPLSLIKDENNRIIGVEHSTNGRDLDEKESKSLKQFYAKHTAKLQKDEDCLIKIFELYEKGERDEIASMLKDMKKLDQFFLFFLDHLEDPKSRAKAGGQAKFLTLNPYKNRAVREYSEKKKENGGVYKQIAFAHEFVETMKIDSERVKHELEEMKKQEVMAEGELEKLNFNQRKDSNQANELHSIRERIRILKRHPKDVKPDTVVTWLVGI